MPSGSHRGSRSHSSGASSRASRGSSYSHRGGVHHRRVGMHFGGRHHRGGIVIAGNGFIPLIICLFVFMIMMCFAIGSYASDAKQIRKEYEYYNQMIERALEDPEYIAEANVTAMYESNGKYYVTYTIDGKGYADDWGISFPIYTMNEARALMENGIDLALAKKAREMTEFTDSVPVDHTIDKMKIDSDYTQCNKMKIVCIVVECILIVAEVLVVVFVVRTALKRKTQGTDEVSGTASATAEYRCNHCGARYPSGASKCSACGSSDCTKVN